MKRYIVNQDQTQSPNPRHTVHTRDCEIAKQLVRWIGLGFKTDGKEAVAAASQYYSDADGCAVCCPEAHKI